MPCPQPRLSPWLSIISSRVRSCSQSKLLQLLAAQGANKLDYLACGRVSLETHLTMLNNSILTKYFVLQSVIMTQLHERKITLSSFTKGLYHIEGAFPF